MIDPLFTAASLTLLDEMWARHESIPDIREKLQSLLGRYVSNDQIREAATRFDAAIKEDDPGMRPPPPKPDVVNLVKPGTYPARGFTMLRGGKL